MRSDTVPLFSPCARNRASMRASSSFACSSPRRCTSSGLRAVVVPWRKATWYSASPCGRRPTPASCAAPGAQLGKGLHLPLERRIDLGGDDARAIRAVATLQPELLRALCDRGREDRVSRLCAVQGAHLLQRALDEEVRRRNLQSRIVPHALGLLIEHYGKGPQPCEVRLGVLPVLDPMLPVEEGRDALVRPRQLTDHVRAYSVAVLEGLGARDRLHLELDRVVVGEIRSGKRAAVEGSQALEPGGVVLLGLAHPLQRGLGEL